MKKINTEVARKINAGGLHYHWVCGSHGYVSVARDYESCMIYKRQHELEHHDGLNATTYYNYSLTSGRCSKIYNN